MTRRFDELQARFAALAADIPEGPQKEALSLLNGMVLDLRRGAPAQAGRMFEEIADLYKTAPRMDGDAVSEPLAIGTKAPDFALPDANNNPVSLADFRGHPVVLVFYPLDWSPTCSDQLSLYQAELPELERFGARIVGISPDSIYSHGAWAAVRGITFPLLSDFEPKGEVTRLYNVWRAGDGFPDRALYVVDGQGTIRYAHVSPRLGRIPDIYELYRALSEITGIPAPTTSARTEGANGHVH